MSLINAFQDSGFSPKLKSKDSHPVIRLNERGFVFDAQRRFKNLILHHGTTLIDNYDYEFMPKSLKATKQELEVLQKGNIWLKEQQNVSEKILISSLEKNLPEWMSVIKKDFTNQEIKLANKLYEEFYTNVQAFSQGKKQFGICYKTNTPYDMEKYAEEDEDG